LKNQKIFKFNLHTPAWSSEWVAISAFQQLCEILVIVSVQSMLESG